MKQFLVKLFLLFLVFSLIIPTNLFALSDPEIVVPEALSITPSMDEFSLSAPDNQPIWDKSSLTASQISGSCKNIDFIVVNGGSGDMSSSTSWELYWIDHGNPKEGSVIATGSVGPIVSGGQALITYIPSQNPNGVLGNYMFKVYQMQGHPGKGELWSSTLVIDKPCEDPWDKSSLQAGDITGDCNVITFNVMNHGSGDMVGSTSWALYWTASGNPKDGTIIAVGSIDPLASGQQYTITYNIADNTYGPDGNYMFKVFQRPGHPGEGVLWSNGIETNCDKNASLTLVKSANKVKATVGETITYTYLVVNNGDTILENIYINDDKIPAMITLDKSALAPGESATGTVSYVILSSDYPGPLVNNAVVTATSDDKELTASASCIVEIPEIALYPILECITDNGDGTFTAYWGYSNDSLSILNPIESYFTGNVLGGTIVPMTSNFEPGRHTNIFSTKFDGNDLVWTIKGPDGITSTATANRDSKKCVGEMPLHPIFECIEDLGDGTYIAWWGYNNDNHFIVDAQSSYFNGTVLEGTTVPPISGFLPGRQFKVFSTRFNGDDLVWTLIGPDGSTRTALASRDSEKCYETTFPLTVESVCLGDDHKEGVITKWVVTNPNAFDITVSWEVEGQTGIHVATPGTSVILATEILGKPNVMNLYIDNKVVASSNKSCYNELSLFSLCSPNPTAQLKWIINNPNWYPVAVTWKILNDTQSAEVIVPGFSNYIFYSNTVSNDPNIAMIFVNNLMQDDGVAGNFTPCSIVNPGGDSNDDGTTTPVLPVLPPQELVNLPNLGVPSLPGNEIVLEELLNFEVSTPYAPPLPKTGGSLSYYIYGILLIVTGVVLKLYIKIL